MVANSQEEISAVVTQLRPGADQETVRILSAALGRAVRGDNPGVILIEVRGPEEVDFYITGRASALPCTSSGALLRYANLISTKGETA